jgi:D-alanine-D-alanine ligase
MQIKTFEESHKQVTVGVLLGGTSPERDVSITSGTQIAEALARAGFSVRRIDVTEDALPEEAMSCDVVFPALHGGFGEDGGIQQLLEDAGIPYVGSGPESSRLCMDKNATKAALAAVNLPTPPSMVLKEAGMTLNLGMKLPLVIKPSSGGSSVLLFIVKNQNEYLDAIDQAMASGDKIMIEQFVEGAELTVALVDGEPLPPVEIVPPNGVYDYDAKYVYDNGKTQYFCPPRNIGPQMVERLQSVAKKAWDVLKMRDLGRIDIILDSSYTPYILEANTLPGFTPTSLVPKAAAQAGIGYDELCTHLVLSALERK